MIAVRVTKEMRLAVVGAPGYFESNPIPRSPRDLKYHSCIGFRFSNGLYRWEFEKGRKTLAVSPQCPASFDDPDLVIASRYFRKLRHERQKSPRCRFARDATI
jgi:hypothetical protein